MLPRLVFDHADGGIVRPANISLCLGMLPVTTDDRFSGATSLVFIDEHSETSPDRVRTRINCSLGDEFVDEEGKAFVNSRNQLCHALSIPQRNADSYASAADDLDDSGGSVGEVSFDDTTDDGTLLTFVLKGLQQRIGQRCLDRQ